MGILLAVGSRELKLVSRVPRIAFLSGFAAVFFFFLIWGFAVFGLDVIPPIEKVSILPLIWRKRKQGLLVINLAASVYAELLVKKKVFLIK